MSEGILGRVGQPRTGPAPGALELDQHGSTRCNSRSRRYVSRRIGAEIVVVGFFAITIAIAEVIGVVDRQHGVIIVVG